MGYGFSWHEQGGLVYLTADILSATRLVRHGFSTRHGGISEEGLNLGLKNDEAWRVRENRRRFLTALGLDPERLVAGQQVHGTNVAVVTAGDAGRGATAWEDGFPATDALITNVPGLPLSVYTADCVPLLFLDPVRRAVGAAHAGWRGSVAGIGPAVLGKMASLFGTKAQDVLVAIGPAIGPCCYEVDEPVLLPLRERISFWEEVVTPRDHGHSLLNLWELNRRELIEAGVPAGNVAVAGVCTACHVADFYSYRAENGRSGSLAAVVALNP